MARRRVRRRSFGSKAPWGNALGGYKTQKRVNGEFASGKGPSLKRKSAKSRQIDGYKKKLAKNKKSNRKRNSAIGGAIVGAVAIGGGVYAAKSRGGSSKTSNNVKLKSYSTAVRRPNVSKTIPQPLAKGAATVKTMAARRPMSKAQRTASIVQQSEAIRASRGVKSTSYTGKDLSWQDPMNGTKNGLLQRGRVSNRSSEIFMGQMKVSKLGGTSSSHAQRMGLSARDATGVQIGIKQVRGVKVKPSVKKDTTPTPYSPLGYRGHVAAERRYRTGMADRPEVVWSRDTPTPYTWKGFKAMQSGQKVTYKKAKKKRKK